MKSSYTNQLVFKILNPINHESLKFVLGALKTSSVEFFYEEENKLPKLRRHKLDHQYYIKLKTSPSNPASF